MNHKREFIKLQTASFLSQSGSHFLTIALAAFVLLSSGSIIQASIVFVLSYLPSVFFSARLGAWIDRSLSKWLLARNELISMVSSALCGVAIIYKAPLVLLCLVLAFRSLLLFIARTGGSKWVKIISPPELQPSRIKFFFLSFFLSTAVAGVLAGTVLSRSNILMVVAIDIATYFLSFLVLLTLRKIELPTIGSGGLVLETGLSNTVREILSTPAVRVHFIAVCLSQAVFQGAYSVLVSYLPILKFHLGAYGVGPFQFAASLGITAGFLAVWIRPHLFSPPERGGRSVLFPMVLGMGITSLLMTVGAGHLPLSLLTFFGFNFAYECIWLFHSSEFFRKTPAACLGRYQFTLTSFASFVMTAFTLAYSILISSFGPLIAITTVAGVGIIFWALLRNTNVTSETVLVAGRVG